MEKVISFQGLYDAYMGCRRRKRRTANAQRYEMRLIDNLYTTLDSLQDRSYSPNRSIRFVARKPKAREIHAADFRDRVVHHWLVPRLERLYEPVFIHDVYSNRLNKGTHMAVDRLQSFMHGVGNGGWYLQLDIANFFNSIDRPILFRFLQHRLRKACTQEKITEQEKNILRWLSHILLRHEASDNALYRGNPAFLKYVPSHKQLGNAGRFRGLPIGNLTSQFFANVYLNELDQFIKHDLKCRRYLRYVDDFILLADSPDILLVWRGRIAGFLDANLFLELKELSEPRPVKSGANFLGYIVYPHYRLVRRRVVGNLREKLDYFETQMVAEIKKKSCPDNHNSVELIKPPLHRLGDIGFNKNGAWKSATHPTISTDAGLCRITDKGRPNPTYAPVVSPDNTRNSHVITLKPELVEKLRSVLASYWGHFKHANSHRLRLSIFRRYPWLSMLFDDNLKPVWEPCNVTGYKSQIRFFRQNYPLAVLQIQRGRERDSILPTRTCLKPEQRMANDVTVTHAEIRENGHLKCGLKRRSVYKIFINYPSYRGVKP